MVGPCCLCIDLPDAGVSSDWMAPFRSVVWRSKVLCRRKGFALSLFIKGLLHQCAANYVLLHLRTSKCLFT